MKFNKIRIKGVVGVCLILLAISAFIYWESAGREKFTYGEIVVFNQGIDKGKVIKAEMLSSRRLDKTTIIDEAIQDPAQIVGKVALVNIPKGLQLSPDFFIDTQLHVEKGQYILQIPSDWLYAYPQTLRRGDRVYFYTVEKHEDNSSGFYADYPDDEAAAEEIKESSKAVLSSQVAYVKDSSNREVVDVVPSRMDGTSSIARLEIITDEEGYEILRDNYNQGFQFIIMYE